MLMQEQGRERLDALAQTFGFELHLDGDGENPPAVDGGGGFSVRQV